MNKNELKRAFPYLLPYVSNCLYWLARLGGWFLLAIPLNTFVVIPALDIKFGPDTNDVPVGDEEKLRKSLIFRSLIWAWVPMQMITLVTGLSWIAQDGRSWLEIIGMVLTIGLPSGGVGIVYAHELMHPKGDKYDKLETKLAEILMLMVSYPHFCVEHILGHHVNVATPEDPASSRFDFEKRTGESFYQFYPRCVIGCLKSAWHLEIDRLTKTKKNPLGVHNRMLQYAVIMAAIYLAVYCVFGVLGVVCFAAQGIIAFTSLEVINYMEHYGLEREELKRETPSKSNKKVYERVLPEHSWNSNFRITNWYQANLGRHSDHHAHADRPYQVLRAFAAQPLNEQELSLSALDQEPAPQYPFGYATMFVIAFLPPLWFAVMNPRVELWRAQRPERKRLRALRQERLQNLNQEQNPQPQQVSQQEEGSKRVVSLDGRRHRRAYAKTLEANFAATS